MADYDIADAFRRIELELIGSMKRNWEKHNLEERKAGFTWSRWQAEQLKGLEDFKKKNPKLFSSRFQAINENFLNTLLSQRETNFFGVNHDRMWALIKASTHDLVKAETAMLRTTNDAYRKVIYNAQVYMASGAGSLKQAIDMASDDFLTKGINCVVYKGGRRVNIATYAEMSLRTANKRMALYADGAKRHQLGVHTVKVSKYGMCSKTCLPWQGRVYVDDVYSGGTADEAKQLKLPLLSEAIHGGLFHPNCKHQLSTYFPEADDEDDDLRTPSGQVSYENPPGTQEHHYLQHQIQRERRLQIGSFDENKIQEHANKERKLVDLDEAYLKQAEQYAEIKNERRELYEKNIEKLKDIPKTLSNFVKDEKRWIKEKYSNISQEKIQIIETKLEKLFSNCELHMAVSPESLDKIVDEGFKNAQEVGKYPKNILKFRNETSKNLFGYEEKIKKNEYEKYGYLGCRDFLEDANTARVDQYGGIIVRFNKDKMGSNVTYTDQDSLGYGSASKIHAGSCKNGISVAGVDPRATNEMYEVLNHYSEETLDNPHKIIKEYQKSSHNMQARYFELQYHGEVGIDKVESIFIRKDVSVPQETIGKLKKKGITIYVEKGGGNVDKL